LRLPWWGQSPTLGLTVFEESHELVQDLHELVDVSAGLRYEICVHFEDQVVETGAVAAKEQQSVVEGLVVLQVTETRASRPRAVSLERDNKEVRGMPRTHYFPEDRIHHVWDNEQEPVLTVEPGDPVIYHTREVSDGLCRQRKTP
jgi:hypothetical protein